MNSSDSDDEEEKRDPVDGNWIAPVQAVQALAKIYGNRFIAKEALADLLLDGELAARAERSWFSNIEYLSAAWRSRHDVKFDENVALSARDWMDSEDWFNDLTRWRWPQARFVLTTSEDPHGWRFLEGVRFASVGVARAIDLAVGAVSSAKGGPNADVQRWARFWSCVVGLAQQGMLTRTRLQGKTDLYEKLRDMDPTILGRRSVDHWIDYIWDHFVMKS